MGVKERICRVIVSVLIVVFLCLVPVWLFIQNIVQSSGAESLGSHKVALAQPRNGYFGAVTPIFLSPASDVCVDFEFLGFDPSSSSASFATVVAATTKAAEGDIQHEINIGYSSGLLVMRSYFGLSAIVVPFPLVDLTTGALGACTTGNSGSYNGGVGFRDDESSYLLGQPRAFPDDWYEFDDTIGVYLCPPRQASDTCAAQVNLQSEVSMAQLGTPSLIATTRDPDLTMAVDTDSSMDITKGNLVRLRFVLHRPALFALYTYWIAMLPFLLIFGLFAVYTRRPRGEDGAVMYSPERAVPTVHEIAFGVAATLVAILPLRAVLVPSSLPNLTRLDIVFGIGIALLVSLSLTWVSVWTHRNPPKQRRTWRMWRIGKASGSAQSSDPAAEPAEGADVS